MIWLRWWASKSYIQRIVDSIKEAPEVQKNHKAIFEDIVYRLIPVEVPKKWRSIYSTQERLEEIIENAQEWPRFILQALSKSLYNWLRLEQIEEAIKEGTQKALLRN